MFLFKHIYYSSIVLTNYNIKKWSPCFRMNGFFSGQYWVYKHVTTLSVMTNTFFFLSYQQVYCYIYCMGGGGGIGFTHMQTKRWSWACLQMFDQLKVPGSWEFRDINWYHPGKNDRHSGRQHFQMYFLERKWVNSDSDFTEICYQESNWQ